MRHPVVFALAAAAYAAAAAAAERPVVAPPPAWVLPAPIPPPPPGTEAVAVTVLLLDQQSRLDHDGDSSFVETAVRIGASQGLEAAALALAWDPALETLTLHRYAVVRDGQRIDLLGDGSKLTVVRRETNLERATLDGQLTATLQPGDIRVGDVVDLAYTRTRRDPALAGHSQQIVGVVPGAPIGQLRARVLWPATTPLQWRAAPGVLVPKETRRGAERELVAEGTNVTPQRPPRGAPVRFQAVNYLAAADFASWREVSALMAPLYSRAAELPAGGAVRAEAARIAAASPDPAARALAALKLVQEQVRYVLLTINDGGYVPAAAELTWQRRFGDCKGKTVLLLALLRELGIDARPALVSVGTGDGLEARLPMPGAFDHVLVAATIAGRTYWLDGTRTGDRALGQIRTPRFHWALPVVAGGGDLVPLVPEALAGPEVITTLDLDATQGLDVPAKAVGEQRFAGDGALVLRVVLAQLPPEQRDRYLRTYWHERYDFVTADAVAVVDDAASGALRLTMTGTAKMDWTASNGRRWYEVDGGRVGFRLDTARDPGPNRDAPFAVDFPDWNESRQTILLPNGGRGFTLDGSDVDRSIAALTLHRHVELKGNRLTMVASTRATAPEIAFADVEAAKTALTALSERGVSIGAPPDYALTAGDLAALKATTPATVEAFVARGDALLDAHEYDGALRDAAAALALNDGAASAYALRALALAWKKDPAFAAAADKALALDPKQYAAWHARALFARGAGRHAEAEAALTKALQVSPDDRWALVQRSEERLALGRPGEAVDDFAAAIKAIPDDVSARRYLVALLMQAGRPTEALAEAERLHHDAPDDLGIDQVRMQLMLATGRTADARAASDALLSRHPDNEEARFVHAMIRKRMGDRDGALAELGALLDKHPRADMLVDRAQMWPIADRAHWSADLDRALTLGALPAVVQKTRALLEGRAGNFAAATTALAAAERADPADAQLGVIRLDLLRRQGRKAEALAVVAAQLKAHPGDVQLLNQSCWTKATLDLELASALADCDAALKLSPGATAILDSRGFVRFRMGDYAAAIADYDAALKLRPDQGSSLYGRGLAKAKAGQDGAGDIAAARKLSAAVDAQFAGYGITPPPGAPSSAPTPGAAPQP